jgi:predicted RNA binding protein YcfA (HicA-like mRNA interferase family)
MSKREKLRQKLRNPSENVKMQEVRTLLEHFGFILLRTRGSHHIFQYDNGSEKWNLVVPQDGKRVKLVYVKQVINTLDEIFPEEPMEEDNAE